MKNFYIKQLLTALLLLCSTVMNAHDFEVNGIYYNITDAAAKTVGVTYKGSYYNEYSNEYTGFVIIPQAVTYNGTTYSVTSIGGDAFSNCTGITGITIPNSVTSIGSHAFYYCSKIVAVHISDLSAWCKIDFADFTSNPLYYAKKLYLNGEKVTNLVIPDDVTEIKINAFINLDDLKSITIGKGVTSIAKTAFYRCTNIESINVAADNPAYHSYSNCNAIIEKSTKKLILACKNTVIPSTVTTIGSYSFSCCSASTDIPYSVTTIEGYAFSGSSITNITIPSNVKTIESYAFTSSIKTVINNSSVGIGSSSHGLSNALVIDKNNISSYIIIGDFIFKKGYPHELVAYIGNDTDIVFPDNCNGEIYNIGKEAFKGNKTIESIAMGNGVYSIGENAFYNCMGLKSITLGDINGGIGSYAFSNCTNLETITLGKSYINQGAFGDCNNIKRIYSTTRVPGTIAGSNAFSKYYATLYVPAGTKDTYLQADYWSSFRIVEIKGDIDGDDIIDVADITKLVSIILEIETDTTGDADADGDGTVDVADVTKVVNMILNPDNDDETPAIPGTGVDLGLSVKWASYNMGATTPEEYGGYYAWGETKTKNYYGWNNYLHSIGSSNIQKYNQQGSNINAADYKYTLEPVDDVAQAKWGGNWRIPTKAEIDELRNKCTWNWTTLNGVNGYRVTGTNGNSIFLPAVGEFSGNSNSPGSFGYYWSSSLHIDYNSYSYCLYLNESSKSTTFSDRCSGFAIRPVCP